ncbi:LOW QUALITY PROTEIN: hypothetical protein QYF61_025587 [Mycteria americana]|uniref:Uncharacterized protein n=1 Tax=Mycteria americana TaxID=33587 RepID=A0AAN7N483_MYCAM|nr:LOW QUALITY PROTEIN: hypothetical protein QYF61_025587 [Mycteria americana]
MLQGTRFGWLSHVERASLGGSWHGVGERDKSLYKLRRLNQRTTVQQGQVQGPAPGSGQSPVSEQTLWDEGIESSPVDKDLGILVGEKLDMTQQCALTAQKANRILGCIQSSMASRSREGILFLYSALTRPAVLRPDLGSSAQERHGAVGAGPEEATKMVRGLEHLCCEDRLRELGLFSLEKRRLRGDLIAAFQYLKGAYKKDGERLFTGACSDRMRGKGFKLKVDRTFFMMRVVRHWNRLPGEAVDAPSLEVFKARLDGALSNLVYQFRLRAAKEALGYKARVASANFVLAADFACIANVQLEG